MFKKFQFSLLKKFVPKQICECRRLEGIPTRKQTIHAPHTVDTTWIMPP
jgi:hypothetical protein